ncbi:MAG: Bax inhibitor-1/YccA family protein [Candidatus Marinimicrobia bacterium]|nr:Bax inhibitor-1/YccA family protein [Candidatus Neomarinimicrobiota bacterium]
MRTANPALSDKTFKDYSGYSDASGVMTINGTVNKTFLMLVLALFPAGWIWSQYFNSGNIAVVLPWLVVGGIGGFIVAMITIFKKQWAMVTAPAYAILEGFVLGGVSAIFESQYPGIVVQAVSLTLFILLSLLFAYKSRLIKVTDNFRLGVVAATGGIALVYFASFILGFFGIHIPMIHSNGLFGIGFSIFVVIIASMNLVLDFDFIEKGAASGAPKFMEWYAAFGLMVTLIWLYLEILRLLAKLRSRR